jgi:hypothetical protein
MEAGAGEGSTIPGSWVFCLGEAATEGDGGAVTTAEEGGAAGAAAAAATLESGGRGAAAAVEDMKRPLRSGTNAAAAGAGAAADAADDDEGDGAAAAAAAAAGTPPSPPLLAPDTLATYSSICPTKSAGGASSLGNCTHPLSPATPSAARKKACSFAVSSRLALYASSARVASRADISNRESARLMTPSEAARKPRNDSLTTGASEAATTVSAAAAPAGAQSASLSSRACTLGS